jgi:hypothetical protein
MFSGIAAIGFINSNRNVSYAGLGGQLVFMMLKGLISNLTGHCGFIIKTSCFHLVSTDIPLAGPVSKLILPFIRYTAVVQEFQHSYV